MNTLTCTRRLLLIVCLRFQVMQIKQVDYKMSTKKAFFKKAYLDIFEQLHTQEFKAMKKYIVRLQLNLDLSAPFCYKRKTKNRFLIFLNCCGDEIGYS